MRLNVRQPVCEPFPIGTDISKRPFAHPQRELAFSSSHSEVNAPGLLLRHPSDLRLNPFQSNVPERCTGVRSPSGFFMPLQITAFRRLGSPEVHLRNPPDPLRSPWRDSINDDRHGSTFQVRYVSRACRSLSLVKARTPIIPKPRRCAARKHTQSHWSHHSISEATTQVVVFHLCLRCHLYYTSGVAAQSQTGVSRSKHFICIHRR
jgi:hypothetical protein